MQPYEPYEHAEKRCSTCKAVKYLSEFSRNSRSKDGYQARCRTCSAQVRRNSRAKLRQRSDEEIALHRPESKICYACRQRKPADEFSTRRCSKDGLTADCRECRLQKIKAKRQENKERIVINYPARKRCPGCRQTLPAADFAKSRAEKDGLQGYCRSCHKECRQRSIAKKRSSVNNG